MTATLSHSSLRNWLVNQCVTRRISHSIKQTNCRRTRSCIRIHSRSFKSDALKQSDTQSVNPSHSLSNDQCHSVSASFNEPAQGSTTQSYNQSDKQHSKQPVTQIPIKESDLADKHKCILNLMRARDADEFDRSINIVHRIIQRDIEEDKIIQPSNQIATQSINSISLHSYYHPDITQVVRSYGAKFSSHHDYDLLIIQSIKHSRLDLALHFWEEAATLFPKKFRQPVVLALLIRHCLIAGHIQYAQGGCDLLFNRMITQSNNQSNKQAISQTLVTELLHVIIAPHLYSKQLCCFDSNIVGSVDRWSDDFSVFINLQVVMPSQSINQSVSQSINTSLQPCHWETIVRVCCSAREFSEARSLYQLMTQQGIEPTCLTYELIMHSLYLAPLDTGEQPSELTFSDMQLSKIKLLALMEQMRQSSIGVSSNMLKLVLRACFRVRDFNNSLRIIDLIQTQGDRTPKDLVPSRFYKLASLVDSPAKAERALDAWKRAGIVMTSELIVPSIIDDARQRDDWHFFLAACSDLTTRQKKKCIHAAMQACATSGLYDAADELMCTPMFRRLAHYQLRHLHLLSACVAGQARVAHGRLVDMRHDPSCGIRIGDIAAMIAGIDTQRNLYPDLDDAQQDDLATLERYALQLAQSEGFLLDRHGECNLVDADHESACARVRVTLRYLWFEDLFTGRDQRDMNACFLIRSESFRSSNDSTLFSQQSVLDVLREAIPAVRIVKEETIVRLILDSDRINEWKAGLPQQQELIEQVGNEHVNVTSITSQVDCDVAPA